VQGADAVGARVLKVHQVLRVLVLKVLKVL